jgi:hypothetical protein
MHLVAGGDFGWDQRLIRHGAIVGQCRRRAKQFYYVPVMFSSSFGRWPGSALLTEVEFSTA